MNTVYNSYGIPIGYIDEDPFKGINDAMRPHLDESSRQYSKVVASILAFMVFLFVVFTAIVLFNFSAMIPLWVRCFAHPQVINLHLRRTRFPILTGLVLIILWGVGGFFGIHHYELGFFSWLGIISLGCGILTYIIGRFQLKLSEEYPWYCDHGNGYGLLALHALITHKRPSHVCTWIQDGILVLLCAIRVAIAPVELRLMGVIVFGFILILLMGYTWYCQYLYKDGKEIEFT